MPRPKLTEAPPSPGHEWFCEFCGETCKCTKQDIGPYEGREVYYDWRSDCCSSYCGEREMED